MHEVDHRLMTPPSLSITRQWPGESGRTVTLWDLRVSQPNVSHVAAPIVHSIEHFLGSLLPRLSEHVLLVAPMGCQTGFYIVTLDLDRYDLLEQLLVEAFRQMEAATETPLANTAQCGWAQNHSLAGARSFAHWMITRQADWPRTTCPADVPDQTVDSILNP